MIEGKNNLQLLPEKRRKIYVKSPGENIFLIIGITIIVIFLIAAFTVESYMGSLEKKLLTTNSNLEELNNTRDREREGELQSLNSQLSLLSGVLDGHILWSEAFARTETLMGQQVQVISLDASISKNEINLTAITTSYTNIARQIASFLTSDLIENVSLKTSKLLNTGRVEFSMDVTLIDRFYKDRVQ
jgi:Tfp pilus assembly protein PilN